MNCKRCLLFGFLAHHRLFHHHACLPLVHWQSHLSSTSARLPPIIVDQQYHLSSTSACLPLIDQQYHLSSTFVGLPLIDQQSHPGNPYARLTLTNWQLHSINSGLVCHCLPIPPTGTHVPGDVKSLARTLPP